MSDPVNPARPVPQVAPRPVPRTALLLLAAIALLWGLNWPVMRVVLADVPIATFRTLCLELGGPALLAIAVLSGERLAVPRAFRGRLLVASFFNVTVWYVASAVGVALIGAGRASIIAFTMPVWTALLGSIFLGEALTARRIAALLCGSLGLAALLLPAAGPIAQAPAGAIAVLAAAIGWAAGTIVVKRAAWPISALQLTGWQFVLGGIPVTLYALVMEPWGTALGALGLRDWNLIAYVLVGPMMLANWAWFVVLGRLPAAVAAMGTLLVPVIATVSGAIVLGETLGIPEVSALVLVLAALCLTMLPPRSR